MSIHSYYCLCLPGFITGKGSMMDTQNLLNFGWLFLHLQPASYYDADILHKWLLQVGNSHVHLSLCLYKCLLHCCALMSLRKTFVSAWADTRRRSGVSCDLIMWRTVFPISRVKQFLICQEKKKKKRTHMQELAQVLWCCCVLTRLPTVLTSNFNKERAFAFKYICARVEENM